MIHEFRIQQGCGHNELLKMQDYGYIKMAIFMVSNQFEGKVCSRVLEAFETNQYIFSPSRWQGIIFCYISLRSGKGSAHEIHFTLIRDLRGSKANYYQRK